MKTKPISHQAEQFAISKDFREYAIWWEQGTGKTKLVIDTVCHLFLKGEITGLLVIAPNGIHGNFLRQECPVHMWDEVPYDGFVYDSGSAKLKRNEKHLENMVTVDTKRLKILVMSYDGVKTKHGNELATNFVTRHPAMTVCDESTAIATPDSERSKKTIPLGTKSRYRRVLSGTPVAEGPFKIFNQMRFLNPNFWKNLGLGSYYVFKTSFGIYKTRVRAADNHQWEDLQGYKNLDYLQQVIAKFSTRVLKEDVLDLPPKIYTRVEFDLSKKQQDLYDRVRHETRVWLDAQHSVHSQIALVRLTRLQQITSGYLVSDKIPPVCLGDNGTYLCDDNRQMFGAITNIQDRTITLTGKIIGTDDQYSVNCQDDDPRLCRIVELDHEVIDLFEKDEDDPRIEALRSFLEPITHKVIIWSRFTRDIDKICRVLGDAVVRYDGRVKTNDRGIALERFRNDPTIRYFVANPQAISQGVTLTQAKTVVYYANSFQLEKRLQSEDRAHRIGQDVAVQIVDFVARNTVDGYISASLREKFELAAYVSGDRLREWIH